MPIHDWSQVDAGIFHDFHMEWIPQIKGALNRGILPADYYALGEQIAGEFGPDILTLHRPVAGSPGAVSDNNSAGVGLALATSPPQVAVRVTNPPLWYALKSRVVTIRHVSNHRIVAVIEIVSQGNNSSRTALQAFSRKAQEFLSQGIHLLVVDLFPPGTRDPQGIHPVIWDDDSPSTFEFCRDSPLTCASYRAGPVPEAFIEPTAVGRELTPVPIFLNPEEYVLVPLESTYMAAFANVPAFWRMQLERMLAQA